MLHSILVGGASDWKDWIKQGSDRALKIQEERKAKPGQDLDALLKAQSEETKFLRILFNVSEI